MKKRTWTVRAVLGLLWWLVIGLGAAQGAEILPVSINATTNLPELISSTVTVSILQNGTDVTATWLPQRNQTVTIRVNGLTSPTISLLPPPVTPSFDGTTNPFLKPGSLTTSAYPGACTNFGSDTGADFTLVTNQLTSNDCGGMAVINVVNGSQTFTFILPQDTNANGIPDIFEAQFCPAATPNCLTAREDGDTSAGSSVTGDGFFAFDEYRGFIASGTHIRTDPRQKDLFVHLVNPQCVADPQPLLSTASLLGGPNSVVSGNPLFTNVDTLISGTRIHRLGYDTPNATHLTTNEWVDRFDRYSVADDLQWVVGGVRTSIEPREDRQVNQNAVYFNKETVGTETLQVPQKGLRIIECLDTSTPSALGFGSPGSPNGPDNALLFTRNIVNYITNTLGATCTVADPCSYSTFQNGDWTTPVTISQSDLIVRAMAFYVAMEIGHTVRLTPTVEGTAKVSYGYHHAPGTGSNLDQAIENKVSNKTGNTFWIPLLYNTSDLQNFKLK